MRHQTVTIARLNGNC